MLAKTLVIPRDRRTLAKRLHLLDRQGEWWSAAFMLSCGLVLALPGDSFAYPAWIAFHRYGMTEATWTAAFIGIGAARTIALVVNGYLQLVTPAIRFCAAFLGLITWSTCTALLWEGTPEVDGTLTLAVPMMAILALKELVNCYLCAVDVGA